MILREVTKLKINYDKINNKLFSNYDYKFITSRYYCDYNSNNHIMPKKTAKSPSKKKKTHHIDK